MTAAPVTVTPMRPPPELAPALAALLEDHDDALAWAVVHDIHEELGWPGVALPAGVELRGYAARGTHVLVSEVACTLAAWLKHGPALARRQPLLVVWIADVAPASMLQTFGGWAWYGCLERDTSVTLVRPGPEWPHVLPSPLWECLDGYREKRPERWKVYETKDEAEAGLSRACILWARAQP